MSEPKETVGDRIKLIRKALNLNQDDFGNALGFGRGAIFNIEKGKVEPRDQFIKLVCSMYKVNEVWLRTGEGLMFLPTSRNEELSIFVAKLQRKPDDNFEKRLVSALSQLSEEEWVLISKIAKKLASEDKEKGEE